MAPRSTPSRFFVHCATPPTYLNFQSLAYSINHFCFLTYLIPHRRTMQRVSSHDVSGDYFSYYSRGNLASSDVDCFCDNLSSFN